MKYLVQQKDPSGGVVGAIIGEQDIIEMFGFRERTGCEYTVYDFHVFGRIEPLKHKSDSLGEPNYHRFVNSFGITVFSGFSKSGECRESERSC